MKSHASQWVPLKMKINPHLNPILLLVNNRETLGPT